MGQPILDLGNSINWDLVVRDTYTAKVLTETTFEAIPDKSFVLESRFLMVGAKCSKARNTWWLGARLSMRLLMLPSTTSNFPAAVEAFKKNCRLDALTLIQLPAWGVNPYLLVVTFPWWFEDAYLEIWKYSGPDTTTDSEALSRIEEKLNNRQLNLEIIQGE